MDKPEYIIELKDERLGLEAYVVIDDTTLGPGKGGIRFVPDITKEEVIGLAKAMTIKNALANLPFGGAKSGIKANPNTPKEVLVRKFAKMIKPIREIYIAGPDMYMGEKEMAIIADEIGNQYVTGKPTSLGGLPHELGSTGFGVATATEEILYLNGESLNGKTVAIEGFGNVGTFTAKFLEEKGAKIVAVSDRRGTIYNKNGINISELIKVKKTTGSVINYKGEKLSTEALFELDVDILIPGARPNVITEKNAEKVKAKYIVEASNIPIKKEIEKWLEGKGKIIVPDVIANAGGVISSYAETLHLPKKIMFEMVEERIKDSIRTVHNYKEEKGITYREATEEIAKNIIEETKEKKSAGICEVIR